MTSRERIINWFHYKPVDRPPYWDWGPWYHTYQRWLTEGLEPGPIPEFQAMDQWPVFDVWCGPYPKYEVKVLEEDEKDIVYINESGQLLKEHKGADKELSMPQFLEFPVTDRASWERFRDERMQPSPERVPADLAQKAKALHEAGLAIRLYGARCVGFFGPVREFIGVENLLFLIHDDPKLLHEIEDHITMLFLDSYGRALDLMKDDLPEAVGFWEDMGYKRGPLISPKSFREFMLPGYKAVTDLVRSKGIDLCYVDSDGNCDELIPLWLEGGVNYFYPCEVASDVDIVGLRRQFGKELRLEGGFDKRAIAAGPEAIEAELAKRITPETLEGGMVISVDHSMPPDISYPNFQYYIKRKKELMGID